MKNKLIIFIFFTFLLLCCGEVKYTQGQRIYTTLCSNCHMDDGSGLNKIIPSISKSNYLLDKDKKLICLIQNGVNPDSLGFKENHMPSFKKLSDVELTNLVNYLQEKFNTSLIEYKLDEVKKLRKECE